VDFLYSLYDALVSINVPSDKARAVVDAMERDMGTTLATKQDLEVQRLATRQDLEVQMLATRQDLEILRRDIDNRFALVDQRFVNLQSQLELKIDSLELRMTVKLGSMIIAAFGLTIAALRLWS
jgi:hypothetical protein